MFIGEVVAADVLKEGEPMTYAYYHQVKRGVPRRQLRSISKRKRRQYPRWQNIGAPFVVISTTRKKATPMVT